MRRSVLLMTILLAGCLPEAIIDPSACTVDPSLEGIWLATGDLLEQCMHDDVEYGPGTQQSIFLVKAFDEHCYLITALDYYLANDGRMGIFGTKRAGPLSQWRAWLAPLGEREYLICNQIQPAVPEDPNVVTSPGEFFPTFEIERVGTTALTLKPVWFPDVLQLLGEAMSAEEYARRLTKFPVTELVARIKADPDAATPDDPRPMTVRRMEASTEPHVQRVLEAFHIVDPLRRPARFNPPQDGKGASISAPPGSCVHPANGLTSSATSPNPTPMARAACTADPCGSTVESDFTASAIGTLPISGGRKQTIRPNSPRCTSFTACAPSSVASTRSNVVGSPPRCK